MNLPIEQIAAVPPRSRPLLCQIKLELGFVPDSLFQMSRSPAALEGLLAMRASLAKSEFSQDEQMVIVLTTCHAAGAAPGMDTETDVARIRGLPEHCIDQIREDSVLNSPRLNALRNFVARVIVRQGAVDPADRENFQSIGFTDRHVVELIMIVMSQLAVIYSNRAIGDRPDREAIVPNCAQVA